MIFVPCLFSTSGQGHTAAAGAGAISCTGARDRPRTPSLPRAGRAGSQFKALSSYLILPFSRAILPFFLLSALWCSKLKLTMNPGIVKHS